ncbi:MAG: DUF6056 family protein [Clostridiales bacterium]|nr:DUF6056 family protein [Clostridiales bacterium]MDO4351022.1 DUF6056 family protein [Eubacteriales bacterium]MDY4008296.1 DUF6056 family protein [Candidatus Limiplasma sp.]
MSKLFARLCETGVSRRALARGMMLLFLASLIPLIAIAPYNYPADDDFGFVLPAATAWVQTGSLWEVARQIFQKTYDTYLTWQGDFVSTAIFGLTPMIFDIRLYFLSNWFALALVCLSAGYLLKGVVCLHLKASRDTFWIVYAAVMLLTLQFMPAIGYSVFWHNGGVYTVTVCFLALLLGLLLRCAAPQSRARALVRGALAALCGFLLGGSFYGPMLGALVLVSMVALYAFSSRQRCRWQSAAALAGLLVALALSASAPGNAVRQGLNDAPMHPVKAVIVSALDSFDLAGSWMKPQLLAALMLILPALWQPLRDSRFTFRRPFWVFVSLYGLFSAAIVPGVYTHAGYDTERYLNALYFYFLIFAIGTAVYWEGALIRWLQSRKTPPAALALQAAHTLGNRFTALLLALAILFTGFGAFDFTIMNTSSLNAAKCLLTGEAARFRQEMAERQEYILATDSDDVKVQPLSSQPYVFKYDRLPFQGIYGRVRYMKMYFELFDNAGQKP